MESWPMVTTNQPGEPTTNPVPKRIVFTTFGSLGDLHPYIAIALGLKARGHEAIIATSEAFRQRVESLGLGFRPVRPDHPDWQADPTVMRRVMTARKGTEYLLREMIMPVLRQSYDDTLAAAEGADLLVSHLITFTTRLVAEKKGLPWVSSVLQPLCFFSAYDPPVLALAPFLAKFAFSAPFSSVPSSGWPGGLSARGWSPGIGCGQRSGCRRPTTIPCSRDIRRCWCWLYFPPCSLPDNRTGPPRPSSLVSLFLTAVMAPPCLLIWRRSRRQARHQ